MSEGPGRIEHGDNTAPEQGRKPVLHTSAAGAPAAPSSEQRPLVEAMARYVAELELLNEGIDRVRELIRRSPESEGWKKEKGGLREASGRLAERVRNWARELDRDYEAIRDRFAGRAEPDDDRPPHAGRDVSVNAAKVALVDRSALFRGGIKKILEGKPGLSVVKEASDLSRIGETAKLDVDILVAHLDLTRPNDPARIAEMKKLRPELMVVLVVPRSDPLFLSRLVRCGADAYLMEDSDDQRFLYAIERALRGKTYLSPAVSEALLEGLKSEEREDRPGLTQREKEVLRLVAEGKSSRDIAGTLFISVHTVERHRANIMAKLDMNKVTDLVRYAISQGLADAGGGARGK